LFFWDYGAKRVECPGISLAAPNEISKGTFWSFGFVRRVRSIDLLEDIVPGTILGFASREQCTGLAENSFKLAFPA